MTPPNAGARYDADASAGVGYTSPPRSYRRQESTSTPRRPSTRCGGGEAADSQHGSTVNSEPVTVAALYVETGGVYYGVPAHAPHPEPTWPAPEHTAIAWERKAFLDSLCGVNDPVYDLDPDGIMWSEV